MFAMIFSTVTPPERASRRRPRKLTVALVAVLAAILLAGGAFFAYASSYYRAGEIAQAQIDSPDGPPVVHGEDYLAFGDERADIGVVLYPGAKVEFSAYAPLARKLSERGCFAVIVRMPFNFAFFNVGAADRARAAFPDVGSWWVGGHSLGGAMAAQYAADHADDPDLTGVVLLAAYSASDLSGADLGAVTVYGSNDLVLDREKLAAGKALLPAGSLTVEIAGGNHAGFGDYGPQDGDGEQAIGADRQQEEAADAVVAYMRERATAAGNGKDALPKAA